MATTYPGTLQSFTNPLGTQTLDSPDHASLHTNAQDTLGSVQFVVGTTLGTNVLKNFVAGDFPARISSTNVLQQVLQGTLNNSTIGTPAVTGGTVNSATFGTPAITGGTMSTGVINNSTIGTPLSTGGTVNNAVMGSPTITIANNTSIKGMGTEGTARNMVTMGNTDVLLIGDTTQIGQTRIVGGNSNTSGHLVPNVADDTFTLNAVAGTLTNKTFTTPFIAGTPATTAGGLGFDTTNKAILVGDGGTVESIYVGSWKNWTPTFTGFSTNPTVTLANYLVIGRLLVVQYIENALGTSNATSFTISGLPYSIASDQAGYAAWYASGANNGTNVSSIGLAVTGSTITCNLAAGGAGWTASSTKGVYSFVIMYGI